MNSPLKPLLAGEFRRRLGAAVLAAGVVGTAAAALPAAAIGRTLPDGRAYEMVTPPTKNGGDASSALASTVDGGRLAYNSATAFADAPSSSTVNSYMAQRTAGGWTTRAMQPIVDNPNMGLAGVYTFADFNADITKSIVFSRSGASEPNAMNVFLMSLTGPMQWVTKPTVAPPSVGDKIYVGRSADASHIVFESSQPFTGQTDGTTYQVWEWVNGRVRLVSVLPDGSPISGGGAVVGTGADGGYNLGTGFGGTLIDPTAVSADGSKIFFNDRYARLFVREDGARTRQVSLSQVTGHVGEQPIDPVFFVAAAQDGSRVYFKAADQLTDDATLGGGLYRFDLGSGVLHFVSPGADSSGVQLDTVPLVSTDGKRAYFFAGAQLVPGKGVPGAHNLYVTDGDDVSFVATLANGLSHRAEATPDGSRFVFQATDQLTSFDNAGHAEVYLFDARDGSMLCVSCGSAGHVAGGDASLAGSGTIDATVRAHVISDDGSRVFFQTPDALVPEDGNTVQDVYEYHDGSVSLISSGTSGYDSSFWVATPDGSNVFFSTRDSLVGWDIDGGATDIYDARIGGGFPEPEVKTPCNDDACQGRQSVAPGASAPATGASGGSNNDGGEQRAPRVFVRPITTTGRRNAIKTGTLTLVVTVEGAGTVTATGKASYGDHRVLSLKSAKWVTKKAGTKHLRVRIPAKALREVRRHHRVALSITVNHNKATRPAHVALTLR